MPLPLFATRRAMPAIETVPESHTDAEEPYVYRRGREAASLLLVVGALFLTLGMASFASDPVVPEVEGANWVGPAGAALSGAIVRAIGIVAWTVPLELLLLAVPLFRDRPTIASVARLGGDLLVILVLAALVHVSFPAGLAFGSLPVGGCVGELFGELMRSLFSTVGSYLIGTTIIALVLIARASFSFISVAKRAGETTEVAARRGADGVRALTDAWNMARAIEKKRAGHTNTPIPIRTDHCDEAIFAAIDQDVAQATREATTRADREAREQLTPPPMALTPTPSPVGTASPQPPDVQVRATTHAPLAGAEEEELNTAVLLQAETDCAPDVSAPVDPATPSPAANPSATQPRRRPKADNPKIVDTSAATEVEKVQRPTPPIHASNAYQLPPFDLLEHGDNEKLVIDEELQAHLSENAQSLISTLGHYGVRGQIREIQPGPTVTTYEMEPEAGIKVSKIASLADDLAMNLGCQVRIVAPIPGKKRVGFEVPNRTRRSVNLRDLIEDRRFQEMKAPLPVVLGRDIVGKPFYADLASMPHVLVAGATGAGKSVGLNVMLASLLYRRSPEDMRLLMVDPKVVELQSFDRIPHMLLPVVTDMRQASTALKWAVDEMERRYQLLANAGTKNIKTYNAWVGRVHRGEVRGYSQPKPTITTAQDGSVVEFGPEREPPKLPTPLPYIVIVVDEFADLMMQQGKEVEASIARLAQKARAAGMHVILATQRPSVDVITGMIKANFPTRVAFKVTQRTDSRTILDEQGAEHLLGRGDMLVKLNGMNETRRVQCPFVSEDEVERLTDFLRKQGDPEYDESILQPRDDDAQTGAHDDAEQDPKYDEAVQIVAETRRCSTSWLQRKLGIGYNRAAKIVEIMEKSGLVGPAQGAKDREVLIDPL